MTLTVGSLFSGIGGLELGLERAGMKTLWQVERDPYARRVLEKHWPALPKFDDVCTVGAEQLAPVDLICGGFPCQDISNAGRRKGIQGERSGLWKEYLRIVRELRPRYVLVENVAALRNRGLDVVLGDLAASGYDAEWDCIPAAALGAPHRRDRLFLVAYAQREHLRKQSRGVCRADGAGSDVAGLDGLEGHVADSERPGLEVGIFQPAREELEAVERGGSRGNPWSVEPDVGRVAYGVPSRVDRLRCLGNAVVSQVAEYVGRRILAHAEGEGPRRLA